MNEEERKLNDWAHEHFRMTHRDFQTLVALISGYRKHELPIPRVMLDDMLVAGGRNGVSKSLNALERMGLAWRAHKYGKSGNRQTWVPSALALKRFPEPEPEIKSGVVNVRAGRKRRLHDPLRETTGAA